MPLRLVPLDDAAVLALWPWMAALVGLVVGSFANVCIHRLPRHESIVHPRSRCPRCQHAIAAWENVPVLSFLLLRGRCHGCGAPISWRYPAVEAANGLLWLAVALREGPSLRAFATMAFVTALLVLALIDLEWHLLPDVITLPGIVFGLALSLLPGARPGPLESALSAAGGYLGFFAIARTFFLVRGEEGMGRGDWKMAAMLGAFFGWQQLLLTILLASMAGTVVGVALMAFQGRSSRHALPFGTFLALGAAIAVFTGNDVLAWYRGLFRG
jgi:leader peptidase (prepilin peptidase)/N-methyltransferase